jgi:hypothetical protein
MVERLKNTKEKCILPCSKEVLNKMYKLHCIASEWTIYLQSWSIDYKLLIITPIKEYASNNKIMQ